MALDATFAALADPTRRSLLTRLAKGEKTLSQLAEPLDMSLMAVQKHVKVLEEADLVSTKKVGRSRHVSLKPHGLDESSQWLRRSEQRWHEAFDRLDEYLKEMQQRDTK